MFIRCTQVSEKGWTNLLQTLNSLKSAETIFLNHKLIKGEWEPTNENFLYYNCLSLINVNEIFDYQLLMGFINFVDRLPFAYFGKLNINQFFITKKTYFIYMRFLWFWFFRIKNSYKVSRIKIIKQSSHFPPKRRSSHAKSKRIRYWIRIELY